MRVHHLNCISICPLGGRLVQRGHLCCHCLLVETDAGLVLVDTGFGLRDVADPAARLSKLFLTLLQPEFREEMTAIRQIERLGFSPRDVRHIVLTHLDLDHAGGLEDFPGAKVHMLATERSSALQQRTMLDAMRYRSERWKVRGSWRSYEAEGERWYGFDRVRTLEGLPDDIVMIPLAGYTAGHAGVAVRGDDGWLLHAGDAYFHHGEIEMHGTHCPLGLRLFQWMMEKNRPARLENQTRLRSLACTHGHEITMFCSHDPEELERLAGSSAKTPAEVMLMRFPEATRPDLQIVVGI
jgi:glyoxylase-like metal-dependent hydrolase (beta-lactamase superfamily II)